MRDGQAPDDPECPLTQLWARAPTHPLVGPILSPGSFQGQIALGSALMSSRLCGALERGRQLPSQGWGEGPHMSSPFLATCMGHPGTLAYF